MESTLDEIETNFDLTELELLDHNAMEYLFGKAKAVKVAEVPIGFFNESTIDEITEMANENHPFVKPLAQTLLKINNPTVEIDEVKFEIEAPSNTRMVKPKTGITENLESSFNIYPNPAIDYLTISPSIDYKNLNESNTQIIIKDSKGSSVYSKEVNALEDDFMISLEEFSAGSYLILIYQSNNLIFSKSFNKIKP